MGLQAQDTLNGSREWLPVDCALHAFGSIGSMKEALLLPEVWMLSEAQMRRIEPYFPTVAWYPAGR